MNGLYTTAWMQEFEKHMEQLPSALYFMPDKVR